MGRGDSRIFRNSVLILSVVLLGLASAVSAKLTSVEGSLLSFYIDKKDHDKSEIRHYLRTKEGKAYKLHFKRAPRHPEEIKSIRLKGLINDRDIEVESFEELEDTRKFRLQGGTQAEARGNQRTLVVPMRNTSSNTGFLYSGSALYNLYFSNSSVSLQSYFDEVSDSVISFTGNVANTMNVAGISDQYIKGVCVPGEELFDGYGWLYALDAVYKQHDLRNYDRVSIVLPNDSLCLGPNTLGIGSLGKEEFEDATGKRFSFSFNFVRSYTEPVSNANTFVSVAVHEMGHNLGLKHDNGNSCGKTLFKSSCRSVEYGGAHSIMGFATNLAHVNAIHQEDLGWFTNEIVNISGTRVDQTVTISPMASDSTLPKAIKIARGDGAYYMVEYRKPVNMAAHKSFNASTNYDGFLVYLNNDRASNDSILFASDFGSSTSAQSFSTRAGFTTPFVDDVNKIQIIPENLGTDSATLRIVIGTGVATQASSDYIKDWELKVPNSNFIVTSKSYGYELSPKKYDRDEFKANVKRIEWDFDGDSVTDKIGYYDDYISHVYRKAGIFTITATVYLADGTTKVFSYENFEVRDYINSSVTPVNSSSSSGGAELNRYTKTKLRYTLDFMDNAFSGAPLKVIFPKSLNKLIKYKKKYKIAQSSKSVNFTILFRSETKMLSKLYQYRNENGDYDIPIKVVGKHAGTYDVTLELKSSF